MTQQTHKSSLEDLESYTRKVGNWAIPTSSSVNVGKTGAFNAPAFIGEKPFFQTSFHLWPLNGEQKT